MKLIVPVIIVLCIFIMYVKHFSQIVTSSSQDTLVFSQNVYLNVPKFIDGYKIFYSVYYLNNTPFSLNNPLLNGQINTIVNKGYIKIYIQQISTNTITNVYNINTTTSSEKTLIGDNNNYTLPAVIINIINNIPNIITIQ